MDGGVLSARYRGSASLVTWKSRGPRTITFIQVSCASPHHTALLCACTYGFLLFTTTRHRPHLDLSSPSIAEQPSLTRHHSLSLRTYECFSRPSLLRSHASLLICAALARSFEQYGRSKNKPREANSTPPREVATPSAASKKQPNSDDTHRTPNAHHSTNNSGMNGVSESSLHSPSPQQAPKSPGPANPRVNTDATTHVCPSQSRIHLPLIFFLRVMLAQRLAELASANADGLLEYVARMNRIIDLGLNGKLATMSIVCSARAYSSDLAAPRPLGSIPQLPPQVPVVLPKVSVAS